MKTAAIGEGISLRWDGEVTEWYVRGHVEDAVAVAWATDCIEEDDATLPSHFVVRHMWARWSCEWNPDGHLSVLRTYWESGRGRFPITAAFDGDDWDHLARIRARRARETARAKATMAAMWPEATVENVWVQTEGLPTLVDLRFPWSRHGTVRVYADGSNPRVPRGDLDAWMKHAEVSRV